MDNPVTNFIEHTGTNIGFLIGKVGSSIARGLFLGVSIKNEETIIETAKKIDEYLEKKNRVLYITIYKPL